MAKIAVELTLDEISDLAGLCAEAAVNSSNSKSYNKFVRLARVLLMAAISHGIREARQNGRN